MITTSGVIKRVLTVSRLERSGVSVLLTRENKASEEQGSFGPLPMPKN